jgi:hypothetical protein
MPLDTWQLSNSRAVMLLVVAVDRMVPMGEKRENEPIMVQYVLLFLSSTQAYILFHHNASQ